MNRPLLLLIALGWTSLSGSWSNAEGIWPRPSSELPYSRYIVVDLTAQRVELVNGGVVTVAMPISSGRDEKPTPPGLYKVSHKHKEWTSTIYHVPMPYFMRFNGGTIGLHGGPLPGYPGSAGCLRLPDDGARELFKRVPIGTPVLVKGKAPLLEDVLAELRLERQKQGPSNSSGPMSRNPRLMPSR